MTKTNDTPAANENAKTSAASERILAKGVFVNNNSHFTYRNNNDLIVGPTRGGKTTGYIIPNLLHSSEGMIIADTKSNLYRHYGEYLAEKGYNVQCIDFADIENTPCGYNPLDFIRKTKNQRLIKQGDSYSEQDVKKIASIICPIQSQKDPFWDLAAQMYLEMFILYILHNCPDEEKNLSTAYSLLCMMGSEEFNELMETEIRNYPHSSFAKKYRMIAQNSIVGKMDASIKGILAQHLDVIAYSATEQMFTMKKQVDMTSFLKQKTALFLNISDADRSQDSLVNTFYTQAFQYLLFEADHLPDSRLPIPVRFLLDDFATNTVIPDFDKLISVIGSREVSVSLIVQSLSQLQGLYSPDKAKTIINNCDHCLYLGGTDSDTARFFSEKFNCMITTVLNLPLGSAFLFERGSAPKKVDRYDLESDEVYIELMEKRGIATNKSADSPEI